VRDRTSRVGPLAWFALATAGPVVLYTLWDLITSRPRGIRVAFDSYDIGIYYLSSRWIAGEGTLYRDVVSEYPLAANLIFAGARLVSDGLRPLSDPLQSFSWTWMSAAWIVYVAVLWRVSTTLGWRAVVLWMNPAVLYFTLSRFDIYPAALTLLWLLAVRRQHLLAGAVWLGLAIAIKGYALFLVPVFAAFVWRIAGLQRAVVVAAVCVAPFVAANAAVYATLGYRAMVFPYRFQSDRTLDTESSTYDAIAEAFRWERARDVAKRPRLATAAQVSCAVLAAGLLLMRRGDPFTRLVSGGLVALLGLISFSLFYSPQFVIWLVPLAACARSLPMDVAMHAYLLATLCYFPIAFDLRLASDFARRAARNFRYAVAAVTACRLAVLAVALSHLLGPHPTSTRAPRAGSAPVRQ
jgi:hypothetical protein